MTGTDVDIVTGLPVDMERERRAVLKDDKEAARLRTQAEFLELMESEEGRKLTGMVFARLVSRASRLILEDPECRAYQDILKDFGVKQALAQEAAASLAERALRKRA